jgi:hypothetical protein
LGVFQGFVIFIEKVGITNRKEIYEKETIMLLNGVFRNPGIFLFRNYFEIYDFGHFYKCPELEKKAETRS